jgi:hypothetical protein
MPSGVPASMARLAHLATKLAPALGVTLLCYCQEFVRVPVGKGRHEQDEAQAVASGNAAGPLRPSVVFGLGYSTRRPCGRSAAGAGDVCASHAHAHGAGRLETTHMVRLCHERLVYVPVDGRARAFLGEGVQADSISPAWPPQQVAAAAAAEHASVSAGTKAIIHRPMSARARCVSNCETL